MRIMKRWNGILKPEMNVKIIIITFLFCIVFAGDLLFAYDSENDKNVLTAKIKDKRLVDPKYYVAGILVTIEITNLSYEIFSITKITFDFNGRTMKLTRGDIGSAKDRLLDEKSISVIEVEINDTDFLERISEIIERNGKNSRVLDEDKWKDIEIIVEAE